MKGFINMYKIDITKSNLLKVKSQAFLFFKNYFSKLDD